LLVLIDLANGRISVRGELDRARVQQFTDAVDVLPRSSARQWSIDAAGITFCDAGGLRGMLHAHEVAVRAGRTLVVTRPSRLMARLLALAGLQELEEVTPDQRP
jgi:anti-anti-sigma factor